MTIALDQPAVPAASGHAGIRRWLWAVAFLVLAMVVVGGATRLTGSGLSITEWRPVTGAIPPLGQAYGVDMLVDESLSGLDEVCFEGGDHESLIRVTGEDFTRLMSPARQGHFATHD